MSVLLAGLEAGWETLQLAAIHRDVGVRSVLRLNKQLAFLQREGYPVPIRFQNEAMGPMSFEVRTRARHARDVGLIDVRMTPMGDGMRDREEFFVTESGRAYVGSEFLPKLQAHPRGKLYLEIFADVASKVRFRKNHDLIKDIHETLYLDDREEFVEAFSSARRAIDAWRHAIDETWRPKSRLELAAAATVDFAGMALDAIRDRVADDEDKSTGKHNILWNAERVLELLELKRGLEGTARAQDSILEHQFDRALNALEVNAAVYGVLPVPDDDEIDALFSEAGAFHPDEAVH